MTVKTVLYTCVSRLWQPSSSQAQTLTRTVSAVQIGSVATAAGIGGGAFFVPLFNILLRFSELSESTCAMPLLQGSSSVNSVLQNTAAPCRSAVDRGLQQRSDPDADPLVLCCQV